MEWYILEVQSRTLYQQAKDNIMESTRFFSTPSSDQAEAQAVVLFRNLSEQDRQDALAYMHRLLDEDITATNTEWGEE